MKVENNTMNRLKKLRNEKKLTLRELAEVLNIHRDSLMRMENGSQGISDEYLRVFFEASTILNIFFKLFPTFAKFLIYKCFF